MTVEFLGTKKRHARSSETTTAAPAREIEAG
jgi:hypothetical protein